MLQPNLIEVITMIRTLSVAREGDLITVDEVKNYLKIDQSITQDDELIMNTIKSAYSIFERFTGIAPIKSSYSMAGYSKTGIEPVPYLPIVSVESDFDIRIENGTLRVPVNIDYTFTLVAGYDSTPIEVKEALLRAIAELYTKRDNTVDVASIFRPFRRVILL